MKEILLIPFGDIDPDILDFIARALQETYRQKAGSDKALPVPSQAYHAKRGQYVAPQILGFLAAMNRDRRRSLLGVIDEDLFALGLNFVFGEAAPAAVVAIIALPRLRQEFYGLQPDRELFLLRAAKEAIHELGHLQGLGHCPDPRCIMHFSNSLKDTDIKEARFCAACGNKPARREA